MKVPIKRLVPDAQIPCYAHDGDAGLDLISQVDLCLEPGQRALIPTGIALELPLDFAALIIPRSGLSLNHGITVVNSPGLIDSNYRGEIKVVLMNTDSKESFDINKGDRIAQIMIINVPNVEFEEVDELDITSRNSNGFGSSGI